ncbi:MAG: hypothetical protein ACHQAR_06170 [Steroidobacterales bacterium]
MMHAVRTLIAYLAALTLLHGCVAINFERGSDMPVAAARQLAQSTQVTVEGMVTVASGTLDDGFAVQDGSGGIYVTRTIGTPVKPGQRARVSGTLVAPNQQVAIDPATIEFLGTGSVPAPPEVKTGAVGPATDGRLIAVRGKVAGDVIDDQPWGCKVYVNDGSGQLLVFIAAATRIDVNVFRTAQPLRVIGFSGRYERHAELLPRAQSDITILQN